MQPRDSRAVEKALARLDVGEDEMIPIAIIERRLEGESPIKIWREYRGITQEQLAKKSGISRGMIAAMEAHHKSGSTATCKKIARALGVHLENIA